VPIFDQGYQHWNGTLSGHGWRWLAIARRGVQNGMRMRGMRIFLFSAWMPALALSAFLCFWGLLERQSAMIKPFLQVLSFMTPAVLKEPKLYRVEIWTVAYDIFLWIELWYSMVIILLIGPNLISQDLRFNALPLYFSRPLRRIDYFLGKLGVIVGFIALVMVFPAIVAWVLGLLFSLDLTIVRDTFPLIVRGVIYGMIVAVSAGLLVLALSSLSRNSRYVALFWLGIWFLSSVLSTVLEKVEFEQRQHAAFQRSARALRDPEFSQRPIAEQFAERRRMQLEAQRQREALLREQARAAERDWRPVVSYAGNLTRIGGYMTGSYRSWETFARLMPENRRDDFLRTFAGARFPWYWSGGVLLGLCGLSICILNFRVKSLDRLR